MMVNLPPYFAETRELLIPTVIGAYGPGATLDLPPPPAPPSGDAGAVGAVRAPVIAR